MAWFELFKVGRDISITFIVKQIAIISLVLLLTDACVSNTPVRAQVLLFPDAHKSYPSSNGSQVARHYQVQQTIPSQPNQPNLHLVKITLPTKGQQVPVGKDLRIFGTSTDNATSNCKVSIKANGVGPYRDASPRSNSSGRGNYSNWNFTITPAYTAIREGQNKITAKFACSSDPTLVSHYSVNVTGLGEAANNTSGQQTTPYLSSSSKSVANYANGNINTTRNVPIPNHSLQLSSTLSKSPAVISTNNSKKPLSLTLRLGKSSAHLGDVETLTVGVTDSNSSKAISGATVLGNISSSSAVYKKLKGSTDSKGQATYSWTVGNSDSTGKYKVAVLGYAPGYESGLASKTFRVAPLSSVTQSSLPGANHIKHSINTIRSNDNGTSPVIPTSAPNSIPNNTHHHHVAPVNSKSSKNSGNNNNSNNNNSNNNNNNNGNNINKNNNNNNKVETPLNGGPGSSTPTNSHQKSPSVSPSPSFGVPITHVPFLLP